MAAQGRTPEGKAWDARRQVSAEPVFGQIKDARGFRRFLLRGLANFPIKGMQATGNSLRSYLAPALSRA
jgi:hypothetical protein